MIILILLLLMILSIIFIISLYLNKCSIKIISVTEEQKMRYKTYYDLINKWLKNKNNDILIEKYLLNRNLNNIVIYGIGELGQRLYEELKFSKVNVLYFIDRNVKNDDTSDYNISVIDLNELKNVKKVDAIIITPIYAFEHIKKSLLEIGVNSNAIIGLDEIINELMF